MMFHRILAAVDDSARAPAVVEAALEIARFSRAELRVLRVITIPPEFPPAAHVATGDPLPAYMHKVAEEHLHALLRGVTDVHWESAIDESHAAALAILEHANRYDADLIVIGSHGYGAIERLLGTTAAKVVNLSTTDVLVVHRARSAGSPTPRE